MLSVMGYDVASAAGGEEALRQLYSEQTCDVVISDIVMPGMSGLELASLARQARPGLPIVFVSGKPEGLDLATTTGTRVLPKPVTRERLDLVLEEALQHDGGVFP